MTIISLKNINKIYSNSKNKVLDNVSLDIEKGDFIAIMGPSGSGKSTLLNIVGCLDKATSGEYKIYDKDVFKLNNREIAKLRNKSFGFVVQHFALLENYTVYNNIKIPLEYSKVKSKDMKPKIVDILKKLKIEDKIKSTPKELSGGQNQRVAIARAIVNNPDVILADEPTGALDSKTGKEVIEIFKSLNKEGKTIIMVTHDINIAKEANKIINIMDGKLELLESVL
ncbi:MAG: ABC transporter ATP-binding protein [Clostridium perfringens]|nr:ABC transporter ATP-binding protein [Clostridium perfringens]